MTAANAPYEKCGSVVGGLRCQLPANHKRQRHEAAAFGIVVWWKDKTDGR